MVTKPGALRHSMRTLHAVDCYQFYRCRGSINLSELFNTANSHSISTLMSIMEHPLIPTQYMAVTS